MKGSYLRYAYVVYDGTVELCFVKKREQMRKDRAVVYSVLANGGERITNSSAMARRASSMHCVVGQVFVMCWQNIE